jgi:hypothetical protein
MIDFKNLPICPPGIVEGDTALKEAKEAEIDRILRTNLSGMQLQAGMDALSELDLNAARPVDIVDTVFRRVLVAIRSSKTENAE